MDIKTATQLRQEIVEMCEENGAVNVAAQLGIKPPYLSQIVSGDRTVSKNVARRLGYKPLHQPRPERIFAPLSESLQKTA